MLKKVAKIKYLVIILLITILAVIFYLNSGKKEQKISSSVVSALSETNNTDNFDKADKVRQFKFPEDSGAHTKFQTEWWYYTGNLEDQNKNHYGFQLTFFRRSLNAKLIQGQSKWRTNQLYFAHFTVSDIKNDKFYFNERFSRGDSNLSGVKTKPFEVWLEDWSVKEENGYIRIKANNSPVFIDLKTQPLKPLVLEGDKGLSHKSAENASYYYSQTRLKTDGIISISDQKFNVTGISWLDREWSTSALSKNQTGWDWFSLQSKDGREIMIYQLRLKNGQIDPFSSGTLIEKNGQSIHLKKEDFLIKVLDYWTSPTTKVRYPAKWQVDLPKYNISMNIVPFMKNQELNLSFAYWEGAVKVTGENFTGDGYVELTGYNEKF